MAKRAGHCRCGDTRFAVSGEPLMTMACHCTGCQRMTAGAFSLSALYPAEAFELVAGEPAIGGLHGPDRHWHCPNCMSWLYTMPDGMEAFVNVRTPMLEGAAAMPPFIESFACEKLPFAETGAPHSFEGFPEEAEFPALMAAFADWDRRPGAGG